MIRMELITRILLAIVYTAGIMLALYLFSHVDERLILAVCIANAFAGSDLVRDRVMAIEKKLQKRSDTADQK